MKYIMSTKVRARPFWSACDLALSASINKRRSCGGQTIGNGSNFVQALEYHALVENAGLERHKCTPKPRLALMTVWRIV
jgi:hypothetical protein